MNDSDQKLVAGCLLAITRMAEFAMIGVTFIYAVTHW